MKQNDQVYVYLLWECDGERNVLLDVYTHKVQAEADMRLIRDDPRYGGRGYTYHITERHTVPHDENR